MCSLQLGPFDEKSHMRLSITATAKGVRTVRIVEKLADEAREKAQKRATPLTRIRIKKLLRSYKGFCDIVLPSNSCAL